MLPARQNGWSRTERTTARTTIKPKLVTLPRDRDIRAARRQLCVNVPLSQAFYAAACLVFHQWATIEGFHSFGIRLALLGKLVWESVTKGYRRPALKL